MAKKIIGLIKLEVPAAKANPAPPIGPALGQKGVNIMEFCKAFNAATTSYEVGTPLPVVTTVYADKSFTFIIKTPPASYLIKKQVNITSGSKATKKEPSTAQISYEDCKKIAEVKMVDLNANDIDSAARIICGTAESMGIQVIR